MLAYAYVGTTRRITAKDLTFINADGSETRVTAGAVVTIVIKNPDNTTFSTDTASVTGDDWSIVKDMPNIAGKYPVLITAVYSGATEKWKDFIQVEGF